MRPQLSVVVLLVVSAACTAAPTEPAPVTASSRATPAPRSGVPGGPSAEDVVRDPEARLVQVRVTRDDGDWRVRGVWALHRGRRTAFAFAASGDGFVTARFEQGGSARMHRLLGPAPHRTRADHPAGWSPPAAMTGLLTEPVTSLAPGTAAVVGGGDGATLFPFEVVSVSTDGGASWVTRDLPLFGGARAYSSGQVVTGDGRLVALLGNFSDDEPGRPAPRHHGLWVSDGDWSAYRPLRVRLAADQAPAPEGWATVVSIAAATSPEPALWITTWDSRVYASTDGGRTFGEIRVR